MKARYSPALAEPADPYLTLTEAATRFRISERTLRRRIADGSLPVRQFGGRLIRIRLSDLEALGRPRDGASDGVAS
jgi:excisionase family DNA binding protein